jgi:RNA polymerase sigma-70 factor (ECF subfamily)
MLGSGAADDGANGAFMQNARTPPGVHGGGNEPSDVELMLLVAGGDREAFGTLVRRHQQQLMNLFRRLGADAHGAEDCAQETFLRLFRSRLSYRPSAPFPAFLYTLARHSWVDWSRRRQRRMSVTLDEAPMESDEGSVSIDDRLDLEAAVQGLPDHLRWVVLLSVDRGLSYPDVGDVLDIPVGTVKSRMFHAIRRLREALHARTPG